MNKTKLLTLLFAAVGSASLAPIAPAATVTRLTPPSALFSFLDPNPPIIARFLQGQRFDVQATIQPESGKQISSVLFTVDGIPLFWRPTSLTPADASGVLPDSVVATFRAYENFIPGVHTLRCIAVQNDGQRVIAKGNFEVVKFDFNRREKIKNVVFMIGDLGAYLHRILGKSLGIVTTADVFDATPAAWAIHTQDRGAGTGICDQYLDEATRTAGLRVLIEK
jgi:alkaline phosphatase